MKISFSQKYILHFVIFFSFFLILFLIPQKSFAACNLISGQFRNFSYGPNFSLNWFTQSVSQTSSQPYVYLDLNFNNDCVGNDQVSFSIQEHDSLDSNDVVVPTKNLNGPDTLTANTLKQTHVFRAGDTGCDSGDVGDCDYFLLLTIGNTNYSFSPGSGGVGSQSSPLNIEYDCHQSCEDQNWSYQGTAHLDNTQGYIYGSYVSSNDPDLQYSQQGSQANSGQSGSQSNNLGQSGEQVNIGTQNFTPLSITEKIENPLGDGSNLPAFVQSLLGIIIKAGIPIIVLAIVYTGFRFVEARGNPNKLQEARTLLLWTIIGTAIVLGAWTIATILTNTINAIIS